MFDWQQTSWEEIGERIAAGATSAMLPVGATEQHGPQLGCGVDTSIAHNLCGEVAKRAPVALLPTLPYGCSIGHSHKWPGTIALQPKPTLVKPEKIAASDDEDRTENKIFAHPVNRTSTNGVTGKPSLASIEKGQELFSWMLDDLLAILEKGAQEVPPINHSYFEKVSS